jgi:hypothetical protein
MPDPTGKLITPVGLNAAGFPRAFSQLFGFTEELNLDISGTVSGTSYTSNTATVPAGELWIVTIGSVNNNTDVIGNAWLYASLGGGFAVNVAFCSGLARYAVCLFSGNLYLVEGQGMGVYLSGVANGDTIKGGFLGYKMEL